MKLLAYLIVAVLFYGIASFINVELNPLQWGTFTKIVYVVGALWSLRIFSEDEF